MSGAAVGWEGVAERAQEESPQHPVSPRKTRASLCGVAVLAAPEDRLTQLPSPPFAWPFALNIVLCPGTALPLALQPHTTKPLSHFTPV